MKADVSRHYLKMRTKGQLKQTVENSPLLREKCPFSQSLMVYRIPGTLLYLMCELGNPWRQILSSNDTLNVEVLVLLSSHSVGYILANFLFLTLEMLPLCLKATSKDGLFKHLCSVFFFHSEEFSFYYLIALPAITLNLDRKYRLSP